MKNEERKAKQREEKENKRRRIVELLSKVPPREEGFEDMLPFFTCSPQNHKDES